MLTRSQQRLKRGFDLVLSMIGLVVSGWLIVLIVLLARWSTGKSGLFRQLRMGRNGSLFEILKVRTMRDVPGITTQVTITGDSRITRLGHFLRQTKLDELPQLLNIVRGEMSFVGPRPDVPEISQCLIHEAPEVLGVRPGITGPASLKYRNEEKILARHVDPGWFNNEVIFPDKMRINQSYVKNYSFWRDLQIIWFTVTGLGPRATPADFEATKYYDQIAA